MEARREYDAAADCRAGARGRNAQAWTSAIPWALSRHRVPRRWVILIAISPSRRRAVLLVVALFAAAALGAAHARRVSASQRADFLLPTQTADRMVPASLRPLLSHL